MKHAARYSIIRFLPYPETEEFTNVGVILCAPTERYFDFRLSKVWRRVGGFFESLDRKVFSIGVRTFDDELLRIRDQAEALFASGTGQSTVWRLFDDVVRPREALFRFSSVRAVMAESPQAKLEQLFADYVEHAFASPEYHEGLVERAVRGVLRREGLTARFKPTKLGTGALRFGVPFAEIASSGKAQRVIKPLHLAHEDPIRIFDHGNQWVARLKHLQRVQAFPEALFLAVTEPPFDSEGHAAFEEVRQGLAETGAMIAASTNERALIDFAREASR
jgi:hypothetical protein